MKKYFFSTILVALITLTIFFPNEARAEKIYKLEYICRGNDPIQKVISAFLQSTTPQKVKDKLLKYVMKKNSKVKSWQNLDAGERINLYLPEKYANKKMMKRYVLRLKKLKSRNRATFIHTVNLFSSMSLVSFNINSPTVSTSGTLFSKLKYFLIYDLDYSIGANLSLYWNTVLGSESFYGPMGENAISLNESMFFQYLTGPGLRYVFSEDFFIGGTINYQNNSIICNMDSNHLYIYSISHLAVATSASYRAFQALNVDGEFLLTLNYNLPAQNSKLTFKGGYGASLSPILKWKLPSIALKLAPTLDYQILNGKYSSQKELTVGLNFGVVY